MAEDREAELRARIHQGMTVLGMDGGALGRVFDVGEHGLALERGAFLPHEWTASFVEVERVDESGVWLRHGRGSLERISDAFSGPIEPYRAAAEASPIHQWTGFRPPAVGHGEAGHPPPGGPLPTSETGHPESSPVRATDEPPIPGGDSPPRH